MTRNEMRDIMGFMDYVNRGHLTYPGKEMQGKPEQNYQ